MPALTGKDWRYDGCAALLAAACMSGVALPAAASETGGGPTMEAAHPTGHWSYAGESGPQHWAELEEGGACGGSAQSPVNIITVDTQPARHDQFPIDIRFNPQTHIHDVVNNGHSIQFDFDHGDEIAFGGQRYVLQQVHFHEPSEHTINGVRYPIEIHMVHVNEALGRYVVLAVMGEEGRPSPAFDFLEQYLPLPQGETREIDAPFNLRSALPTELEPRFHYAGSLTTPPCTESVDWVVFQNTLSLSYQQVVELQGLMPLNNYRDTQALNARRVSMVVH